jgi:hypothetical protein
VSKKTVTFKMPVKSAAPAEDEPPPILESAGGESGSDAWVRHAEADPAPAVLAAPSFAHGPTNSLTIDLTAERDFPTVAALMLAIPPMLGWFYLANIMNRYWSRSG